MNQFMRCLRRFLVAKLFKNSHHRSIFPKGLLNGHFEIRLYMVKMRTGGMDDSTFAKIPKRYKGGCPKISNKIKKSSVKTCSSKKYTLTESNGIKKSFRSSNRQSSAC